MKSTKYEIGNYEKHEARNSKYETNSNYQMTKCSKVFWSFKFRSLRFVSDFDFRYSDLITYLFRISNFKFRISRDDGQKRRFPTGFTLVEAVVSLVIVSGMLVAALSTVGASRLSQQRTSQYSRGQLLAEALMAEILRQNYQDPNDTPVFGCEPGESTSTRADFDDVDDYNGWSESPPARKDGSQIAGLSGWQWSVTVQWVDPADITQVQASETNAKRITVIVTFNNKQVGSLTAIRTNSGL